LFFFIRLTAGFKDFLGRQGGLAFLGAVMSLFLRPWFYYIEA
jgi:hypothetical protein